MIISSVIKLAMKTHRCHRSNLRNDQINKGKIRFRMYVGGMGGQPMAGEPLASFVPVASLPAIVMAIHRLGERRNRERARLNFGRQLDAFVVTAGTGGTVTG